MSVDGHRERARQQARQRARQRARVRTFDRARSRETALVRGHGHRGGAFALFVDRPVLTLMTVLAILALGAISLDRLPLRFLPAGLSQNEINVWIPIPTSQSPQEVRDKIVEPLEELLRTIPGLERVRSTARSGSGRVSVKLDEDLDPTLAAAEIRDRVQRAMLQWPAGVDRYFTWKEDGSAAPLAFMQMLTPERDSRWDHLMDEVVRNRLEAVDGVGRIDVWGLRDESIRIWFHRDRLQGHRVDFREVLQKLRNENFAEPVGELDTGRQRFLVRVDHKFRSTSEIEELPIRPGLRLKDIADVERVPEVRDRLSRYDRKYTYTAVVRSSADANPVEASKGIRAAAEELMRDPRLAGLDFRFMFDQGEFIEQGLANLLSAAFQGGFLALIVLWLFLRNLPMTTAIAMTIPLTLLLVGCYLFFTDNTLNICTMAGMTLAVGMVVDNSVVVLENIRRLREQGASLREACITGAREVALPVAMATMTTVVVFLPMSFMGNKSSRITMGAVGIPLSVALIGSLFVALQLLPSGVRAMGRMRGGYAPRQPSRWSPLTLLLGFNRRLLAIGLRRRLLASAAGATLLSTAFWAGQQLDFAASSNIDPFQRGDVAVEMSLPRGLTLSDAEAIFTDYERHVLANEEKWHVQNVGGRFGRDSARVDIFVDPELDPDRVQEIRSEILTTWPRKPGVRVTMGERRGHGMSSGTNPAEMDNRNFVVRLWGRDSEYLMERAEVLRERLLALPETETVDVPSLDKNQEVVVQLDRDRTLELGVGPEVVMGTVAAGLQGRELTRFEEAGREIRLLAQYDPRQDQHDPGQKLRGDEPDGDLDAEPRPSLLDLKETRVFSGGGTFQRLDDLGEIGFRPTVADIDSEDGRTNVMLIGRRADGVTARELTGILEEVMRAFPLERGYTWSEESPSREAEVEIVQLFQAMALSVVLVFLLMGVLFESVILPLSILVTVPFALFGATWSLFLFHGSLDPMGVIGMVILCGVVVNNGIVLLDYIHRMRGHGMDRATAILEGVRVRMRPIFMTAATTLFGLLPMAVFGDSSEGISYVTLSIAVAGGLLFCTVFTAVTVPLAYTFADDVAAWLRGVRSRALPRAG